MNTKISTDQKDLLGEQPFISIKGGSITIPVSHQVDSAEIKTRAKLVSEDNIRYGRIYLQEGKDVYNILDDVLFDVHVTSEDREMRLSFGDLYTHIVSTPQFEIKEIFYYVENVYGRPIEPESINSRTGEFWSPKLSNLVKRTIHQVEPNSKGQYSYERYGYEKLHIVPIPKSMMPIWAIIGIELRNLS